MGQKVHPYGYRLGYIRDWKSRWFAGKKAYAPQLLEDVRLRRFVKERMKSASVSNIEIERAGEKLRIIIFSARPGIIIGRQGAEIERLKEDLATRSGKQIFVDIKEVQSPSTDAQLIAENIAFQLERRIPFRRAMKRSIQVAMQQGALGIKIQCKGRLQGAEIARCEGYKEGKIPLQTIRADIEYGFGEAMTAYGTIGVKVWVYKGDIIKEKNQKGMTSHGAVTQKS